MSCLHSHSRRPNVRRINLLGFDLFDKGLTLGLLACLPLTTGCLLGNLVGTDPTDPLPAPATRLAPLGVGDETPRTSDSQAEPADGETAAKWGLRPAPVPQDLPLIPIARE